YRGRKVRLTFHRVRRAVVISKLVGQWWLYHEAHLCSSARFSLHVLVDMSELEIEANELTIDVLPRKAGSRRKVRKTREIEVNIGPNVRLRKSIGISRKEFEEALPQALDKYHALMKRCKDDHTFPSVYEMPIEIKGITFALEDIAHITL